MLCLHQLRQMKTENVVKNSFFCTKLQTEFMILQTEHDMFSLLAQ